MKSNNPATPYRYVLFLLLLLSALSGCLPSGERKAAEPTLAPTESPTPAATGTPSARFRHPTPTVMPLPTQAYEAPDATTPQPTETPLLENYMPGREVVGETEHFIFYAKDGYFPVDQDWWMEQAELLYDYVSERLDGAQVKNKIEIGFLPPEERACPVRGLAAYSKSPAIIVYADERSSRTYLLGVLSHELGHAIPSEGFPGGLPDDDALTEGLATWASGKYWLDWQRAASFDLLVRRFINEKSFEAPTQNFDLHGIYPWENGGSDCLARRDRVYSTWGAFTGYLVQTYGWEKMYQLYEQKSETKDGKVIVYPPDYEGIFGKSLNQLEFDWLMRLMTDRITI